MLDTNIAAFCPAYPIKSAINDVMRNLKIYFLFVIKSNII